MKKLLIPATEESYATPTPHLSLERIMAISPAQEVP